MAPKSTYNLTLDSHYGSGARRTLTFTSLRSVVVAAVVGTLLAVAAVLNYESLAGFTNSQLWTSSQSEGGSGGSFTQPALLGQILQESKMNSYDPSNESLSRAEKSGSVPSTSDSTSLPESTSPSESSSPADSHTSSESEADSSSESTTEHTPSDSSSAASSASPESNSELSPEVSSEEELSNLSASESNSDESKRESSPSDLTTAALEATAEGSSESSPESETETAQNVTLAGSMRHDLMAAQSQAAKKMLLQGLADFKARVEAMAAEGKTEEGEEGGGGKDGGEAKESQKISERDSVSGDQSGKEDDGLSSDQSNPEDLSAAASKTEAPTSYKIYCAQNVPVTAVLCQKGALSIETYVGDENLEQGMIFGESNAYKFHDKCRPFCNGERSGKNWGYVLPVKPGRYEVKVYAAEHFWSVPGPRAFSIYVQGKIFVDSLDIMAEINARNVNYDIPPVVADCPDGVLNITFVAVRDNAVCNAIHVYPEGSVGGPSDMVRHSRPLPFQFFCSSHDEDNVAMVGPSGPVPGTKIGRFLEGPFLYSFRPTETGTYEVYEGTAEDPRLLMQALLHSEECTCPLTYPAFKLRYDCPANDRRRVSSMLERWMPQKVTWDIFAGSNAPPADMAMHCAIVKNELYCKNEPQDKDAWQTFRSLLLSLLRKVQLDDVEFYWHAHGRPIAKIDESASTPPVLGPTANPSFADVPIPSASVIASAFAGRGLSLGCTPKEWKARIGKAYFRAGSSEFAKIVKPDDLTTSNSFKALSHIEAEPFLFDAKVYPTDLDSLGRDPLAYALSKDWISTTIDPMDRAFEHKVVLDIEGRRKLISTWDIVFSGSGLVQQKPENHEWYQSYLEPSTHLYEVDQSIENVVPVVEMALKDVEVTIRAALFALQNFTQEALFCWTATVLQELRKTLAFDPEVRAGMKKQDQPEVKCSCQWELENV